MLPNLRVILASAIATCVIGLTVAAGLVGPRNSATHVAGVPELSHPLMRQAIVEDPEWQHLQLLAFSTRRSDELIRLRSLPATPARAVVEYAERARAGAGEVTNAPTAGAANIPAAEAATTNAPAATEQAAAATMVASAPATQTEAATTQTAATKAAPVEIPATAAGPATSSSSAESTAVATLPATQSTIDTAAAATTETKIETKSAPVEAPATAAGTQGGGGTTAALAVYTVELPTATAASAVYTVERPDSAVETQLAPTTAHAKPKHKPKPHVARAPAGANTIAPATSIGFPIATQTSYRQNASTGFPIATQTTQTSNRQNSTLLFNDTRNARE